MCYFDVKDFSHTEKLGDLVQCSCVTPFQMTISDWNNWGKKVLIKYLLNIQSSAEKCILYTEAEVFLSPL